MTLRTSYCARLIAKTSYLKGGGQQNVENPKVVVDYKGSMADRVDHCTTTYCFLKWTTDLLRGVLAKQLIYLDI